MNDLYGDTKTPADLDLIRDRALARALSPEFGPRSSKWLERPGNPCSIDSDGAGYPEPEDWED